MMSILTNKRVERIIAFGIYAVIALFAVIYVQRLDLSKLKDLQVDWLFIVLAIPFSIISRVFLPYIWIRLIRIYSKVDSTNEYWQLNYIYAKSWLGRYIPGKIAWIGGKIYFALQRGISKTVLGVTSVVEALLQLLSALLLGVLFLFVSGAYSNFSTAYNLFFLSATLTIMLAILPPLFNRLFAFGYKLARKKPLGSNYFVTWGNVASNTLLYMLVHALSALPIYFLTRAIGYNLGLIELLYIAGAFIFAGAIGTLAVVTPSGLGVREGVMLLFLVNILPAEISLAVVVILRLWSIILDVLYWMLSYMITKISTNKTTSIT